MIAKDLFGQEIKVGDFVINAAAQYRSGVLRAGIVQNVSMRSQKWNKNKEILSVSVKRVTMSSYNNSITTRTHHETDMSRLVVLRSEMLPNDSVLYKTLISLREEIFKKRAGL